VLFVVLLSGVLTAYPLGPILPDVRGDQITMSRGKEAGSGPLSPRPSGGTASLPLQPSPVSTGPEEEYAMRRDEVLRVLARFQDLKRDEFGIIRIGVFGSVARDEMSETSDVDVVVEVARPDLLTLVGIKQELEELLHLPVDVVRYRERMNPFLKGRIKQEAIYV
jgi:hypothetical protein